MFISKKEKYVVKISQDSYEFIRQHNGKETVVADMSTPVHLLEKFSQSDNPALRWGTVLHPNIPVTSLIHLANNESDDRTRKFAERRLRNMNK